MSGQLNRRTGRFSSSEARVQRLLAEQRHRCAWCSQLAPEAELERVGTTESKPGWCGGPRQGGRPVFAHPACVTAAEADYEATQARLAAARDAYRQLTTEARAARDAGDQATYDRLMAEAIELATT